jgi:hypothetical protein
MALVFEQEVHFDAATAEAIIWADADDASGRFKLVIARGLLIKQGLKKYFDEVGARKLIADHRAEYESLAQDAHKLGARALNLVG